MTITTLEARNLVPTLTVNDIRKSLAFYRDALGFSVTEEYTEEGKLQGVMLEAGGAVLGLSQDDFSKGREREKGIGMRFHLETEQDVDTLAQQAEEAGIALNDGPGPLPWGAYGFSVTDPDGFKITISEPSE